MSSTYLTLRILNLALSEVFNMQTYTIKHALKCCIEADDKVCETCPYNDKTTDTFCNIDLMKDALKEIELLNSKNKDLQDTLDTIDEQCESKIRLILAETLKALLSERVVSHEKHGSVDVVYTRDITRIINNIIHEHTVEPVDINTLM